MHLALVTTLDDTNPGIPRIRHLRLDECDGTGRLDAARIDLMIVDTRAMDVETIKEALKIVDGFNTRGIFRRAILLAATPSQPLVVGAMRAGIGDLYFGALNARALMRNLRAAWPRGGRLVRGKLAPLVAIWSLLETTTPAGGCERKALTEREVEVSLRESALEATSRKLADVRRDLDKRHTDLLARERLSVTTAERIQAESLRLAEARDRLEEAVEKSASNAPFPVVAPAQLRQREEAVIARQRELDLREKAIVSREALLREYEAMLAAQLTPRDGA